MSIDIEEDKRAIALLADDVLALALLRTLEWTADGVEFASVRVRVMTVSSHIAARLLAMAAATDANPSDFIEQATVRMAEEAKARALLLVGEVRAALGSGSLQ